MVSSSERLELMTELARLARDSIQSGISVRKFGRLRQSIRFIVNRNRVIVYSTYFWIRFVNDGRGPVRSRPGGPPLIFFKDPKKDPRIASDYPRRRTGVIRLTPEQFKDAKAAGDLIITKFVRGTQPERFIEAGIARVRKEAPLRVRQLIQGRTRQLFRRRRDSITVVL